MAENPKVHSKGMTYHGKPHAPQKVASPGAASPKADHGGPLSQVTGGSENARSSVHHAPASLGHMERGQKASHPGYSRG